MKIGLIVTPSDYVLCVYEPSQKKLIQLRFDRLRALRAELRAHLCHATAQALFVIFSEHWIYRTQFDLSSQISQQELQACIQVWLKSQGLRPGRALYLIDQCRTKAQTQYHIEALPIRWLPKLLPLIHTLKCYARTCIQAEGRLWRRYIAHQAAIAEKKVVLIVSEWGHTLQCLCVTQTALLARESFAQDDTLEAALEAFILCLPARPDIAVLCALSERVSAIFQQQLVCPFVRESAYTEVLLRSVDWRGYGDEGG